MRNTHCRKPSRRQKFPVARAAGVLGLLSASPILVPALVSAVSAAEEATPAVGAPVAEVPLMEAAPTLEGFTLPRLRVGQATELAVASNASVKYVHGADLVQQVRNGDKLMLTALRPGRVVLQVNEPGQPTETYVTTVLPPGSVSSSATARVSNVASSSSNIASSQVLPSASTPASSVPSGMAVPNTSAIEPIVDNNGTNVSPRELPLPSSLPSRVQVPRRTAPPANAPRPSAVSIPIRQGMGRLLTTSSNILAVYFSDENIVDARAINARTLAVTGKNPGKATLAIFTARSPEDVVGQARVYTVEIHPQSPVAVPVETPFITDPGIAESAIRAALDDRRIAVSVIRTPAGNLAAVLTGTVQDAVEVEAARRIASYYVPEVVPSLVIDPKAPRLGQEVVTTEESLQSKLRLLTGNETIQLVPFPNSLVVKAEVGSAAEADTLMRLLPSLNQKVTPLIVIRGGTTDGAAETTAYIPERPVLNEDDERNTQLMQGVTGLRNIYVVRTAKNGLAVYGTVRDRAEYERLYRYARILPQMVEGTGDKEGVLPANAPFGGNQFPLGVQLFVRVLDPEAANVRQVNVETNVVEISRTGLRNLGVEFGSASLISESITGPTTTVTPGVPGGVGFPPIPPIITTNPGTVSRTIDPTFRQGVISGGNGFAGTGGFNVFDPFRARLNALYQNGNARILSQPNLSVIEGMDAQIVIGGERPIPVTTTSGGGSGTVQESIEFRRFGIILTMRPTVSDDQTILLQIRADVTEIDFTTAINRNNALIPGERVRSVDTTLAVREGDIIVMGGLMTNERRQLTSKVPILSSIPILGKLFQSKRFENNETELALFMTPRIRRLPVSPETGVWVRNAPGWPGLPDNQGAERTFNLSGTPRTAQ